MKRALVCVLAAGMVDLAAARVAAADAAAIAAPAARVAPARLANLTIDVQNAPVTNVLRLLADVGQVNIVFGDDVKGNVTLKLKSVAWTDALRVVLLTAGLDAQREGGVIWVAPASTVERARSRALDAMALHDSTAPLRTRLIPVRYADAQALAAHVRALLSPRGTVSVDARTNTLIVRDVVPAED